MSVPTKMPIPYLPRIILPSILLFVLTIMVCWLFPNLALYVGLESSAPRTIDPYEYGSIITGYILCLGLAPRFLDWDLYGLKRTRILAVLNLVAVLALALLAGLIGVLLYPIPEGADESKGLLLNIGGNISVAVLLAIILVGLLGRFAGSVIWILVLYSVFSLQARLPWFHKWLPFNWSLAPDGSRDQTVRWLWIIVLLVGALAVTWVRRSVPIRILHRSQEG